MESYQHLPAADAPAWGKVDPAVTESLRQTAERLHQSPAVLPTATEWMEFRRIGNRSNYEARLTMLQDRLVSATLAACLVRDEGEKTRWSQQAADDAWVICELTTWCLPAHHRGGTGENNRELPVPGDPFLDLDTAIVGALLAWTSSLLAVRWESACPTVLERIHDEVRLRVLTPFTTQQHWWFGSAENPPNNWAAWIVSNVMACALVVGTPGEQRLATSIGSRIMGYFRAGYELDGACEEGATYWWVAALAHYEALVFINAMTGEETATLASPLVAAMGKYPHQMQVHDGWQATYGDGSAKAGTAVRYHTALRYALEVRDQDAALYARSMGRIAGQRDPETWELPSPAGRNFHRVVMELLDSNWVSGKTADDQLAMPYPASTFLPSTGTLCARESGGSSGGLFLAIQAGHNGVRHNHNDVGSFTVFADGKPVVIDVGVESYRRETFDESKRYGIWTMRSGFHNLPLINGREQLAGKAYAAINVRTWGTDPSVIAEQTGMSMNLEQAYGPIDGLKSWRRSSTLDRSNARISIVDSWQGQGVRPELVLMLANQPEQVSDTSFTTGAAVIGISTGWDVAFETVEVSDPQLTPIWGTTVYRAVIRPKPGLSDLDEHRLTIHSRGHREGQ